VFEVVDHHVHKDFGFLVLASQSNQFALHNFIL